MSIKINFPGISQDDFDYAIHCLEICKESDAPDYGFNYPYFTPGGHYGKQWWQLDSSLCLGGYKWIDRSFSETSLKNFIESQKEDGRICLWGKDEIPSKVAGDNFPLQGKGVSSLPKLFDSAFHILKGATDKELIKSTYNMLKRYLDWWFNCRLDEKTGLISSVFEETFTPYLGRAGEYAGVDTNVEVYVGLTYVKELAEKLSDTVYAAILSDRKAKLKESINTYLWNEEKSAYYPYDLVEGKSINRLIATTFAPMRMGIADRDKRESLISLMTDDSHFNWNTYPLTSVSKKDSSFVVTEGRYQGNASWSGSVWTLMNETVIRGLCDSGEDELAAELALKTIRTFNHNCAEFASPYDGKGHGVIEYGWSASQYIQLLVEVIFGVNYDAETDKVTVTPHLTEELKQEKLSLSGLQLAKGKLLDVVIDKGNIEMKKR